MSTAQKQDRRSSTAVERQKRLVLSCTKCRARKVKCDRIKPCHACCVRGEPSECTYSTTDDSDFVAVSQSYEIRKLRNEVKKWKELAQSLKRKGTIGSNSEEALGSSKANQAGQGSVSSSPENLPDASSQPEAPQYTNEAMFVKIKQQERKGEAAENDGLYFGAPAMSTVVAEFTNMQLKKKATLHIPRAAEIFSANAPPPFPFPTLWPQVRGLELLVGHLPTNEIIADLLHCFRRRAQCAYPFVYEELQQPDEIVKFLRNRQENAEQNPGILAMIYIAMALGVQVTVYERAGFEWSNPIIHERRRDSEIYLAAAMQTLRHMSFMNRPNLLVLQTMLMMLPYLTNSGRFTDAWVVLGTIIRIAQSMGFHRNPELLDPRPTEHQSHIRRVLWWWIHYQDVHYSMTLGRPLGISGIGDAPPPLAIQPQPATLQEYILPYTIILRQALSSNDLTDQKIDEYTHQLLKLHALLPDRIRFNERVWLQGDFNMPPWPLPMQAVLHCTKVHSFIIVLNRRKKSMAPVRYKSHYGGDSYVVLTPQERMMHSARMVLHCQNMVHTKIREGMLCWTQNQQSFNAAMIIGLNIMANPNLPKSEVESDIELIKASHLRYADMEKSGLHELAGIARQNIGKLIDQLEQVVKVEESSETMTPEHLVDNMNDVIMTDGGMFLPDLIEKKGEMYSTCDFSSLD